MSSYTQVEPLFLRVTKDPVRQSKGLTFFGVKIDPNTWSKLDSRSHYVVEVQDKDTDAYINELGQGAVCKILPETHISKQVEVNGFTLTRHLITTMSFMLERTSGKFLINLLAENSRFRSIGAVKAQKLWNTFGEDLYGVLDNGDTDSLNSVLSPDISSDLIETWQSYIHSDALFYCCHELGLTASQAFNIHRFYGEKTKDKIEGDPYRLLAFNLSFSKCDDIALGMGISKHDPRRLLAASEQALYTMLDKGSVVVTHEQLIELMAHTLADADLAEQAIAELNEAPENFQKLEGGFYQSNGAYVMEKYVASRLADMLQAPAQLGLEGSAIEEHIAEYEKANAFTLTEKQKQAVIGAAKHPFYLINGGAGVGKTTVLDALYHVFDHAGMIPIQVALAAKAAKRMSEATGREAFTIERFIRNFQFKGVDSSKLVLVIDESSMVDLHSMYRLLSFIPDNVRIIMVGDVGQLPPIGFGLVLHEIIKADSVPQVTLDEVKRQSHQSNIPTVAGQIRVGQSPELQHQDVQVIPGSSKKKILDKVVEIYSQSPDQVQVICPTRALVTAVNQRCAALNKGRQVKRYNEQYEAYEETWFREGDKVMCIANLYDWELMNGSLGTITIVYGQRETLTTGARCTTYSYGQITWDDGLITEITDEILENLEHAYAMTIHKSQGSQFHTVVIPLYLAKNMDRSMLYTAVTRAKESVLFVGQQGLIDQAIAKVAHEERKAHLGQKLESHLL
ncbi:AAA family ATPase [Endozoicomonas acroporae]|uniref:AAA family ATPase n=1 Tax=Endozoicomonas acroporae TaxID=1701104 RepID=UPI000C790112|nr:AAA family ATPase [Endozoicomonas acroporae]